MKYILLDIVHYLTPYLGNALSMLTGIIVANFFWKSRIHRYAKTEVVETLEFQKNKIEHLKHEIKEKKDIISDLRGSLKVAKIAALKIVGVVK